MRFPVRSSRRDRSFSPRDAQPRRRRSPSRSPPRHQTGSKHEQRTKNTVNSAGAARDEVSGEIHSLNLSLLFLPLLISTCPSTLSSSNAYVVLALTNSGTIHVLFACLHCAFSPVFAIHRQIWAAHQMRKKIAICGPKSKCKSCSEVSFWSFWYNMEWLFSPHKKNHKLVEIVLLVVEPQHYFAGGRATSVGIL